MVYELAAKTGVAVVVMVFILLYAHFEDLMEHPV